MMPRFASSVISRMHSHSLVRWIRRELPRWAYTHYGSHSLSSRFEDGGAKYAGCIVVSQEHCIEWEKLDRSRY